MKIVSNTYHDEFPVWTLPEWAAQKIRDTFPGMEVVRLTSRVGLLDELKDADILFTWVVRPEHVRAAKKLKWIHTGMAGLTSILIPEVVNSDIIVSNSKGVHAIPIAEHTMALMLEFSRRLAVCLEHQRQSIWRRRDILESRVSFSELLGKTICILGMGAIGTEIAKRAKAFGMRVVGIRRQFHQANEFVDALHPASMLDELLPSVDFLVIAAPATDETTLMIGRHQLDRMKPSAFIVNIARGEIIDQNALVDALNNERIAGAGLDVFVPDPLPDNHPLFSTRNLVITPHVSGISPMLWHRVLDIWIENIRRFQEGKALVNQVDKKRGY
jgi:phosphoglycerate dehydrogenase-like enzyme